LARVCAPEAIETLKAIMLDAKTPPAARLGAANALLDRGYGRPGQSVGLTFQPPALHKLTDEQLDQYEQLLMIAKPDGVELPAPSPRDQEVSTTASVPRDDWQEGSDR
jgi:hypothetical protein